jgi:argininosuccinate lyase
VRKGVPFRDAHEAVARAVRAAEAAGCDLSELPLKTLKRFSFAIGTDVFKWLTLEGSVAGRNHIGGTAPAQVKAAIARARSRSKRERAPKRAR